MIQSHVIDVAGIFAGAAIRTAQSFCFVAVDPRVKPLHHTEWGSLAEMRQAVASLMRTGRLPRPAPEPAAAGT